MEMTFVDAAEQVLREAGEALPVAEMWRRITAKALVESVGVTPEQTLRVALLRQAAGSSLAAGKGTPRFYRRGDGAFGLWAELSSEQRKAIEQAAPAGERVPAREFAADRAGMRAEPAVAGRTLSWLVPAEGPRRAAAELLAELIEDAHAAGPGRWKLTLGPRSFRLTVGRIIVSTLQHGFWFAGRPDALAPADQTLIEGLATRDLETPPYRTFPQVVFFAIEVDLLAEAAGAVRNAVRPVIREAAAAGEVDVHGAQYHSPGAVEWLSKLVGRALPTPTYGAAPEDDPPETAVDEGELSLGDLIEEYVDTFVSKPEVRDYLAGYERERAAARANLTHIDEIERAGGDPTDSILLGLLPYTDSVRHREAGAWVSHAPAIQGNFKTWFENVGWVKAETRVLAFVRACLASPLDVRKAIGEFTANPLSRGFGVGMLTPILNALAPDELPLVNAKVAQVVSYFSGTEVEATLADYPQACRLLRTLVDGAPQLRDPRLGIRPGDAFDHFCHWLVAVRRYAFPSNSAIGAAPGYWKISPGPGAELWDDWKRKCIAAIGGRLLGDLTSVDDEEFLARVASAAEQDPTYKLNGSRQSLNLARMPVGTLLVANRGRNEVVGLGRVTGPYRFLDSGEYVHELPVEWFDTDARVVDRPGWARTLVQLDKTTYEEIAALPPRDRDVGGGGGGPPPPRYDRASFLAETGFTEADADRWLRILQGKKQIIIQGPPGTGKTWVAERLARWLVNGAEDRIRLTQFHPAYSYEDFIQGIRPRLVGTAVSYELAPGSFLDLCREMPRQGPVVLIIDEINRANLPRVFGELMYLLEYRDRQVRLASGGNLQVPRQPRGYRHHEHG
ncbi:MAG: AAA family ATPase [Myxococcales bacterium]|nr:AAA family ATPase [Myxococcales bacterium]